MTEANLSLRAGRYLLTTTAGERVHAFMPAPLPPDPALDLRKLQRPLERASSALGRLDGLARRFPDPQLFIDLYVRKEAVLSSQIEGTQSSLADFLQFEAEGVPNVPLHEVTEVSNYVAALEHGLHRARTDLSLSLRLLREVHAVLLQSGRGADKAPGAFRRSQNWIGGTRPGNAIFVPPPPEHLMDCLAALENFLHQESNDLPTLVKAGLAHVQFETIHPFLDGNGRVGRLLITLILCLDGLLREPLLYLSLYFKQHRTQYYGLLQSVRLRGAWEEWLAFFLEGVITTADQAATSATAALELFEADHARLQAIGRLSGTAFRVHDWFGRHPIGTIPATSASLRMSEPPVGRSVERMVELGILEEITGRKRDRVFAYRRYLDILAEGTEPLPR